MSLFEGFENFHTLYDTLQPSTEDYKLDVPPQGAEEVPTTIDENGTPVEQPQNTPPQTPPVVIQTGCPITITSENNQGTLYTVVHAYIRGTIVDLDGYIPLIDLLNKADANSKFYLHIQSGGGMVTTGATIASAIAACKGHVTTIAEGLCASAASLIWSAGHTCEVYDYAMFMYHMSSHADLNNSLYIAESAQKMVSYVKHCLMRQALSKGHVTQDEYVSFCENKDEVWISAKDMRHRLAQTGDQTHE